MAMANPTHSKKRTKRPSHPPHRGNPKPYSNQSAQISQSTSPKHATNTSLHTTNNPTHTTDRFLHTTNRSDKHHGQITDSKPKPSRNVHLTRNVEHCNLQTSPTLQLKSIESPPELHPKHNISRKSFDSSKRTQFISTPSKLPKYAKKP